KGQPKLGLWYPKDSPFDLEAYTDSDYAGLSLDKKSTIGDCQFLRSGLISWQCKKQTIVANYTTKAEYVAAASCRGQVLWIQNQMLDYRYNFMSTKIFIDNESTICIVKNLVFHSKTKHIEIRHHFFRDSNKKKLIQMIKIYTDQNVADFLTKAFDVPIFQYLITSIERKLMRIKIDDGNAFWNEIGVNAGDSVNAARHTLTIASFLATAKAKTVNGEVQIQALVDGKKVIVIETSVRRALQLKDAEGKDPKIPIDPQHTPTIIQPFTSQPQKKQPRRKQRKDTEVPQHSGSTKPITDEAANAEYIPTYSNDPLFSEITKLKERVKKLERRNKSRTTGLKSFTKVGRSAQVISSKDEGLGAQEDAFKQGRKIIDLDADVEEVEVEKAVSTAEVTTVSATTTTVDELTLDQTLIEIKAAKPNAITTTDTTTKTAVTRPKARGVVVQEPTKFRTTTSSSQTSQLPQAKDKGKAKMIEPEKPLKKKDQILIDKEIAQKLQAQLNAQLEEKETLAKQREEDANITEWDNVKAMIDADYELAARLQAQEQEELTVKEKSKLFIELMDKRKKHFARLKVEEQRRNPPTKAQKRNQMCTYLKIMAGFTHNSEVVKGGKEKDEGSVTRAEESTSKRAGTKPEQERIKKQKIDDDLEEG
ncbi:hypothetical protein Tco_1358510, partial [Tanacetum coccineum]